MIAAEPDVWRRLAEGLAQGRSGWLVTVLSTWGAAPRLPGSVWVLWDDGTMMGSVSGGCIEEDLQSRLRTSRSPGYRLFGLTYGDREGDRERFRLPCGGTLHLVAGAPSFPYPTWFVWRNDISSDALAHINAALAEIALGIDAETDAVFDQLKSLNDGENPDTLGDATIHYDKSS